MRENEQNGVEEWQSRVLNNGGLQRDGGEEGSGTNNKCRSRQTGNNYASKFLLVKEWLQGDVGRAK